MGFFKKAVKSITKSVKSITKAASQPAKLAVGIAGDASVPDITQEASTPGAVAVEAPVENKSEVATGDSEADRKRARAGGKKSLSVARSSGGGINI